MSTKPFEITTANNWETLEVRFAGSSGESGRAAADEGALERAARVVPVCGDRGEHVRPSIVDVTPDAIVLAEKYILQGTLPVKARNDAQHLAIATVATLDAVVSWNMRHMVKLRTRREVNAANLLNGYRTLDIVTPEEVI